VIRSRYPATVLEDLLRNVSGPIFEASYCKEEEKKIKYPTPMKIEAPEFSEQGISIKVALEELPPPPLRLFISCLLECGKVADDQSFVISGCPIKLYSKT